MPFAMSQTAPNLNEAKNISEKISLWQKYCNELLTEANSSSNYSKLAEAAKQGIVLTPTDSIRYKAMFSAFAGVAYENMKHV